MSIIIWGYGSIFICDTICILMEKTMNTEPFSNEIGCKKPAYKIYIYCPDEDRDKLKKAKESNGLMNVKIVQTPCGGQLYTRAKNVTEEQFLLLFNTDKELDGVINVKNGERIVSHVSVCKQIAEMDVNITPEEYFQYRENETAQAILPR